MLRLVAWLLVGYGLVVGGLALFQRHLVFVPMGGVEAPARYGLVDFAEVELQKPGAPLLAGWYHPARMGFPTILFFHGNGGNVASRHPYYALLVEAGFGLLAVDYRGYGRSVGEPSEAGFYDDGRAMVAYAQGRLGLKPAQLVLYGESIGSGVAVQMATEMPAAGLVLQSPFASLVSVVSGKFPWVPVEWLLRDRFDSIGKMGRVGEPLLVMHGAQDGLVPIAESRACLPRRGSRRNTARLPVMGIMTCRWSGCASSF